MSVLPLPLIHMTQRPASYQWAFLPPQSELGLDRYVRHEDVVSVDEPFSNGRRQSARKVSPAPSLRNVVACTNIRRPLPNSFT